MNTVRVQCLCGSAQLELQGDPVSQFYCHCDDCQAIHGAACVGVALFPRQAVRLVKGETSSWTYKTMPRHHCPECGTRLFAQPGSDLTGVPATLLPHGMFQPEFHIRCRFAVLPVDDALPHYAELPAALGGSGETVGW